MARKNVFQLIEEDPAEETEDQAALQTEEVEEQAEVEEPQAAAAEESEAEEEPEKKPDLVPSFRLREETEKRRAMEAKMARMEERFEAMRQRLEAPPPPKEDPIPAYEEDPGGHLLKRQAQMEKQMQRMSELERQQMEQAQQAQFVQQVAGALHSQEAEFSKEAPDYYDAAEYLRNSRMAEYQALGWAPADARRAVDQEAIGIAYHSVQNGASAAQRFYELAKLRGYRGRAPSGQDQIQRAKQAQARSTSLGPSGKSPKSKLTLAEMADLSDEEFDKLTQGDSWAKLWQ